MRETSSTARQTWRFGCDSSGCEGSMADDLEKLCSQISLTEGEQVGISITEGEVAEVRKIGELCLVERICSERNTNKEAFKSVLSRI